MEYQRYAETYGYEEVSVAILPALPDNIRLISLYRIGITILKNDLTTNEYPDNRKSDVVYLPHSCKITESTPPITVEIQRVIDWAFIRRIMRYGLSICDKHKVMPKVIVFAIKGFSSKAYLSEFTLENGYYTLSTAMWAQTIRIYTIDSIADLINEQETLKPTVALSYFLCSQEKSIISLDLCDDEEMKKLYSLTNEIFFDYVIIEDSARSLAPDIIDKTGSQSMVEVSPDQSFVVQYLAGLDGKKANWKVCYKEGKKRSLFDRLSSFLSLKDANHK
ncbi:hypothetical protein HPULCUR_011630 [Helicostylum pulchrum]|uniref:Uncharacterized protein n=1 Tax=Helicostylum pulchrum TaxID=562976 RepID=A0ABP9YGM4_9FUNG